MKRTIHPLKDLYLLGAEGCVYWQASPPISKGATPVAGQVMWARALFARCRSTMDKVLQLQPNLTSQALGLQVNFILVLCS